MSHKSEAILVGCSDPRLRPWYDDYLKRRGFGADGVDLVMVPGAIPALGGEFSQTQVELIADWIKALFDLHRFDEAVLTSHEDCGAVGGAGVYNDREKEETAHIDWCERAGKALRDKLPDDVKITLIYVTLEDFEKFAV